MAKINKLKATAWSNSCQNKAEVMENIAKIGEKQRELTRLETEISDIIAQATNERKNKIDLLQLEIESLQMSVQIWCEANREKILKNGLKTANLITGEVSWRFNPPSVRLYKSDVVLEKLKEMGLTQFIRTKDEINKDAILADPKAVADIKGITIVSGVEDFIIKPFEVSIN